MINSVSVCTDVWLHADTHPTIIMRLSQICGHAEAIQHVLFILLCPSANNFTLQKKDLLISFVILVKNTNFATIFQHFICHLGSDNVIQVVFHPDMYILY